MKVKWHNKPSKRRDLPGVGPQGSSMGLLEYDSQSNNNTDLFLPEDKSKFVDNLSMLKIMSIRSSG